MRKLTRPEIEACGKAMPKIMQFHDKLIGSCLRRVIGRPISHPNDPQSLIFELGATLVTQYDDEGNPGDTEWQIVDREGRFYHSIRVDDIIGHPVTGVGYFYDEDNDDRRTIPYVEIANVFLLTCMTRHGGGVIHHHRPREDKWDLFCQLNPKL
jgi:hypothetical protein